MDSGPQAKNEIPAASKVKKEYRESKDSNDGGKRFGSCAVKSCRREALSSRRIVTPSDFNFEANAPNQDVLPGALQMPAETAVVGTTVHLDG